MKVWKSTALQMAVIQYPNYYAIPFAYRANMAHFLAMAADGSPVPEEDYTEALSEMRKLYAQGFLPGFIFPTEPEPAASMTSPAQARAADIMVEGETDQTNIDINSAPVQDISPALHGASAVAAFPSEAETFATPNPSGVRIDAIPTEPFEKSTPRDTPILLGVSELTTSHVNVGVKPEPVPAAPVAVAKPNPPVVEAVATEGVHEAAPAPIPAPVPMPKARVAVVRKRVPPTPEPSRANDLFDVMMGF